MKTFQELLGEGYFNKALDTLDYKKKHGKDPTPEELRKHQEENDKAKAAHMAEKK